MRIGMGQMFVEMGNPEANLGRAVEAIHEAASRECDIVVLPECLDWGWTFPDAAKVAQGIPGATSKRLSEAAKSAALHVVAGLTERDGAHTYNAAILIGPDGHILLKHRKVNILDIARKIYTPGNSLQVADTPFGRLGLNICADNFPEYASLGAGLAGLGARYLLSPCAWAVDASHDNEHEPYGDLWLSAYRKLAVEHGLFTVGVSNVGRLTTGPWEGKKCIGCSLAVDAKGTVCAQGSYGEAEAQLIVLDTEDGLVGLYPLRSI